ncbi:hypothetical protein E1H12_20105 [Geitlerinema sp. P-1104]|uniref:hypothetical protein n=1 Tax=Geitlerinema sp. P-1104 TaxID=2546230 RepID=UPI0014773016|nr:hypothetical protein [Geitlerinema sp. P-1104]NMG60750.1 hypothetical protein [Geitlerinema sp. P-1104]
MPTLFLVIVVLVLALLWFRHYQIQQEQLAAKQRRQEQQRRERASAQEYIQQYQARLQEIEEKNRQASQTNLDVESASSSTMTNPAAKIDSLQRFLDKMIDEVINHDLEKLKLRVEELKLKYRKLNRKQIANKIVNGQAVLGGMLAAPLGVGGVFFLAVALPVDLIKSLRLQAYMIICLRYLYGYPLDDCNTIKDEMFLIMAHSSIEDLKDFVSAEAKKQVKDNLDKKEALTKLAKADSYKLMGVRATQVLGTKYGAKVALRLGEKQIMNHALRKVPQVFRGIIWRLGGRKIAQRALQRAAGRVVPIVGAVMAAGIDGLMTKKVGKVAIDYYETDGPYFLEAVYTLVE